MKPVIKRAKFSLKKAKALQFKDGAEDDKDKVSESEEKSDLSFGGKRKTTDNFDECCGDSDNSFASPIEGENWFPYFRSDLITTRVRFGKDVVFVLVFQKPKYRWASSRPKA